MTPSVQSPVAASYELCDAVADTNVSPGGSRSLTVALVVPLGPRFVTEIVNVTDEPSGGDPLLTCMLTCRSAAPAAFTEAASALFSASGWISAWDATEALFTSTPGAATVPTIVIVGAAPTASEPIVQSPVAVSYVPCAGVALLSVNPAGSGSAIVTPVAGLGPRLVTVTVNVTVSP